MAEPIDIEQELSTFGPRLAGLRRDRGWGLAELAERSGLSKPFLSRLEAGERQPSIAAVLTLAKVFGVSVGVLLEAAAVPVANCVVVRGGEVEAQQGDGIRYTSLSNSTRFANLQPIRLTVFAGRTGDEQFRHDGEEWLYVLSGRLRVTVAGEVYDLESGDAAHFDSRQPHRLTARDGLDAEVIVVACPLPEEGVTVTGGRRAARPKTARAIADP